MAWEIVLLEPVEEWFLELCDTDTATAVLVERAIDRLAEVARPWGGPWATP